MSCVPSYLIWSNNIINVLSFLSLKKKKSFWNVQLDENTVCGIAGCRMMYPTCIIPVLVFFYCAHSTLGGTCHLHVGVCTAWVPLAPCRRYRAELGRRWMKQRGLCVRDCGAAVQPIAVAKRPREDTLKLPETLLSRPSPLLYGCGFLIIVNSGLSPPPPPRPPPRGPAEPPEEYGCTSWGWGMWGSLEIKTRCSFFFFYLLTLSYEEMGSGRWSWLFAAGATSPLRKWMMSPQCLCWGVINVQTINNNNKKIRSGLEDVYPAICFSLRSGIWLGPGGPTWAPFEGRRRRGGVR